jgi:ankyrin repeat protein
VIRQGHPEPLLRLLVSAGVDINVSDNSNHTPLCVALTRPSPEWETRLLLELGADPNRQSLERTPLGIALQTGKAGLVKLLLEKGADPKQTGTTREEGFHRPPGLPRLEGGQRSGDPRGHLGHGGIPTCSMKETFPIPSSSTGFC